MKRVFIIKDKYYEKESWISKNAQNSLSRRCKAYYNIMAGSKDENYVKDENNVKKGDCGIILILSYSATSDQIESVYIGETILNEKENLEYSIYRKIGNTVGKRAIQGIIEKIDLNIDKDFSKQSFVKISNMESLYDELRERIYSVKSKEKEKIVSKSGESIEKEYRLGQLAQKEGQSIRIYSDEKVKEGRTEFQRDRERVVNCKAFRRLVDKAQIFSAEKGDHYRTRMTHTLEVNQIAKAISFALNFNLDLTEAIALGHDLGHTPFGHQGERTIDNILRGETEITFNVPKSFLEQRCFGGFKHNYQSAKILTQLEEKYIDYPGLDVSVQVVEGVLKHTKLKKDIVLTDFLTEQYIKKMHFSCEDGYCTPATLEGQVVSIADEIAQRGHDVDDALTSKVMSLKEFLDRLQIEKCLSLKEKIVSEINEIEKAKRLYPNKEELIIGRIVSLIVNYFIEDVIDNTIKNIKRYGNLEKVDLDNTNRIVDFSEEAKMINDYLEKVVQKKVICNSEVARADYNASMIIITLFKKYYENPRLLHTGTLHKIFIETLKHSNEDVSASAINLNDGSISIVNKEIKMMCEESFPENIMIWSDFEKREEKWDTKYYIMFEKRRILIRNIVDFIAGMTDGYALEEYKRLI